jgi:hypothetical protein
MKKAAIIIILVLVAAALIIFGVKAYRNYQDEKSINSSLSNISQIDKKFNSETDRAKKLTILENIEKDFTNYKKSRKVFSKVSSTYTSEISKMKKYFTDGYDEAIEKNTISDVSAINDKTVLSTNISNLQAEEKLVANEVNYVCDSKQLNTYSNKINTTIDSYNDRIKAIEDAEAKAAAEAKAKADAEAAAAEKAKQEAAAKQKENQSNNGSNSSGKASGSSSNHGSWKDTWEVDANGNEIPGTRVRHYEDGSVIGPDGKFYTAEEWATKEGLDLFYPDGSVRTADGKHYTAEEWCALNGLDLNTYLASFK